MSSSIHSSLVRLRCSAAAVWAGFGRDRSAPPCPALDRVARLFRFHWDHASSALSSRPARFHHPLREEPLCHELAFHQPHPHEPAPSWSMSS